MSAKGKPVKGVNIHWLTGLGAFGLFLVTLVFILSSGKSHNDHINYATRSGKECYTQPPIELPSIDLLTDVMTSRELLEAGPNIFFHQTSCQNYVLNLTVRQACSIESAAVTNPDSNVFVLFASPTGFRRGTERPKIVQMLDTYENVRMHNVDMWSYAKNTSAHDWVFQPPLYASQFSVANIANLLRLISLYKFGGTYLDLDVIVRSKFEDLGHNFAGFETTGIVNNCVMNFESTGMGHFIADECIRDFVRNFNGSVWGANGPVLLTRVLKTVCNTPDLEECLIFKALPKNRFYPISWYLTWKRLFDPEQTEAVLDEVNGSTAVHLWNHMSDQEPVRIGAMSAYERLAMEFCPKVYAAVSANEYF